MKPITVTESVPVKREFFERTYTYEDIVEIWGEDSDDLIMQLARQCKGLTTRIAELERAIVEARRHWRGGESVSDIVYDMEFILGVIDIDESKYPEQK